jgi:hypothetical protein
MSYEDIPLATDAKSQSQADIRDNFLDIASVAGKDHVDFVGTPADLGKHEQATFTLSADDPGTEATERAIYCKNNSAGNPALWIQAAGAAAADDGIDFTTSLQADDGWVRLASGILIKWGGGTANGGTDKAFPVGADIPVFTAIYQVNISTNGGGGLGGHDYMAYLTAKTILKMTVYGSARTANAARNGTYTYLAIGK